MKKEEEDRGFTHYLGYVGLPFVLFVAPVLGYFAGDLLDGFFNTSPYLSYLFLIFGIVAAIREFYKMIKEFSEKGDDDQKND